MSNPASSAVALVQPSKNLRKTEPVEAERVKVLGNVDVISPSARTAVGKQPTANPMKTEPMQRRTLFPFSSG
jgi:hypothetical protein